MERFRSRSSSVSAAAAGRVSPCPGSHTSHWILRTLPFGGYAKCVAAKKKAVLVDVTAAGAKGGKIRAAKLSAKQRSEIARKAARARWNKP